MTLTKRQSRMLTQAAGPILPELPHTLDGWQWKTLPTDPPEYMLIGPDGWTTKAYQKPPRVVQEAERRALSLPKKAAQFAAPPEQPPADDAPADAPADAMALIELVAILDEYAQARPSPLPLDYVIARPSPLPERFSAPLDLVVAGRWQPRTVFDEAELQDLASSIAEHGVLTPVLVFANEHGQLELIGGERRLRASRLAGKRFIPVDVRSYSLRQIAEISAIDNLQRSNLTAVEEGKIFERLISELGVSEAELARRIGRSRGNIQQKRAVASADPAIHDAVTAGTISFTIARTIIGAAPGAATIQRKALAQVVEKLGWGQRLTEADVKKIADGVAFAESMKQLAALGWTTHKFHDETVIFGGAERPKAWSGAEVLDTIRAERRPTGAPAMYLPPDVETKTTLQTRGYTVERLGESSWFVVREGYSGQRRFLTGDEVHALGAEAAREIVELQAAYAAAGWALAPKGYYTETTHPDGAYRSHHSWSDVRAYLADIQAGKVATKRAESQRPAIADYPCARCETKTSDWAYVEGARLCRRCADVARAELKERAAAERRRLEAGLAPLLAMPSATLYLLVQAFGPDVALDAPPDVMLRALVEGLHEQLGYHASGDWQAALPPDPGVIGPTPGTLPWLVERLERIEARLAGAQPPEGVEAVQISEDLAALDEALEALAEVLDDETYEGLSRRLSDALEAMPE